MDIKGENLRKAILQSNQRSSKEMVLKAGELPPKNKIRKGRLAETVYRKYGYIPIARASRNFISSLEHYS